MQVLIATSYPREQLHLLVILSRLGHTVRFAEDGLELLQSLADGRHDLLLLDWDLPVLDAETVLSRMRAGEAGKLAQRLPVIVISRKIDDERTQRAEAAGARNVLRLPADAATVQYLLEELIRGAACA